MVKKEKLLKTNNFFFCPHVFKKLSAGEVSESVYMRERLILVFHSGKHSYQRTIEKGLKQSTKLLTLLNINLCLINPFPHIDAFRRLFENMVTKEAIF